jgi:HAMP domain-containing protein
MTLQARTVLMVTFLLVVTVMATAATLAWSARRSLLQQGEHDGQVVARLLSRSAVFARQVPVDVERAIGEQMVVQAALAAHLVAIAEAAGLPPARINAHLRAITEQTALDEFWITDPDGRAYLRSQEEIDFTFSPDPRRQPQAHVFWPLLTGEKRAVIQAARRREVDTAVYKYAGVAGIDRPRIVQVGYHAALLERLERQMGLSRLVSELVSSRGIRAIRVVDRRMETLAFGSAPGQPREWSLRAADAADVTRSFREGRVFHRLESDGPLPGESLKVIAPLTGARGERIAAAMIYLPTEFVRTQMGRGFRLAVTVAAIVLLIGLPASVALARRVTEPVACLTAASAAVESGVFNAETLAYVVTRTDELGRLARVFERMAREVQAREQRLKEQVQQLWIEVDQARRERQVAEITGTDYFQQLQRRARELRRQSSDFTECDAVARVRSGTSPHDDGPRRSGE